MPRPPKSGLDYFPLDADLFSDRKIRILMARFGADGLVVYLYILCQIYRDKGYYTPVDDDFQLMTAADLSIAEDKVGQIQDFLLERALLDETRFRTDHILTSVGVQRRYQEAIRSRASKSPVSVESRFWLLPQEETKGYIERRQKEDFSQKNPHISEKNSDTSVPHTPKESKEKEKEKKEQKRTAPPPDDFGIEDAEVVASYQRICRSLPRVRDLTEARRRAIRSAAKRLAACGGFDALFHRVEASDFLTGRSGGWQAGFDWILRPANLAKILEGNYDNRKPSARSTSFVPIEGSSLDLESYEEELKHFVPVYRDPGS